MIDSVNKPSGYIRDVQTLEIYVTINRRCYYLVLGVVLREAILSETQADLREAVE